MMWSKRVGNLKRTESQVTGPTKIILGWQDPLEDRLLTPVFLGFPCGLASKESACNVGDLGSIHGLGRSPGEGKGYPLQYSGLENSMDCIVNEVAKSWTWLSNYHSLTHRIMWGPGLWIDGEGWCGLISAPILWLKVKQCWTTISALELPACCQDLCCYLCSVILFAQPIFPFLIDFNFELTVLHRIILVCFQGRLTWDISLLLLIREVGVPDDTAMKWQSLSSSGSVSGTEPCRSAVDMWHSEK